MSKCRVWLFVAIFSCVSVASSNGHLLDGEDDYQMAKPYLAKITQIESKIEVRRGSGMSPKESVSPYKDELSQNLRKATSFLMKASEQGHPVASYRLGQILNFFGAEEDRAFSCDFLGLSLRQGFSPAAIEMAFTCLDLAKSPDFLLQAEKAARSEEYSEYFPQPSVGVGYCSLDRGLGLTLNISEGDLREYRAVIYLHLSRQVQGAKRDKYLKLAADNGCEIAVQRLNENR